jgi:hypothetical protein
MSLQGPVLTRNFATQASPAGALYRDGQAREAVHWIDCALASGAVDALLFYRAGQIYPAAGDEARGRKYMERALHLNPAVAGFHPHH